MIRESYLDSKVISEMKTFLEENGFLRLDNFSSEENCSIENLDFVQKKIADECSYSVAEVFGELKEELKRFLEKFDLGTVETISLRRFSHRDYTLIKDGNSEKGYLFFYFVRGEWDGKWGGNLFFNSLEGEQMKIVPKKNSFLLIKRNSETKAFIQYVTNLAGKNSFEIICGRIN